MKLTVRVNHDDQPEEVAEKFIGVLRDYGITVNQAPSDPGEPWIDYDIIKPDVEVQR